MAKRSSAEARVRPMSGVKSRSVEWLWPGWIALGKLTVLDGDPNLGKSTLLLDLAARVSRDGRMPDGSAGPVGASLILSAEDGEEDAIKPRLAGAVARRVCTLSAVKGDEGAERLPEVPRDLPAIETAAAKRRARLIVIDPLMAYLTGMDASRDQDVRRVLFQLARLAERQNCALVCQRRLNKRDGEKAIYRGGGSIGIVAAARTGLLVAADPDDPQRRVLAATKCNLAPAPQPLRFRLEPCGAVCRVEWLGATDVTPDELVRRLSGRELAERAEERSKLAEAVDFLGTLLADGPRPTGAMLPPRPDRGHRPADAATGAGTGRRAPAADAGRGRYGVGAGPAQDPQERRGAPRRRRPLAQWRKPWKTKHDKELRCATPLRHLAQWRNG